MSELLQKSALLSWLAREKILNYVLFFSLAVLMVWMGMLYPAMRKNAVLKQETVRMQKELIGTEEAVKRISNLDRLIEEKAAELKLLNLRTLKQKDEATIMQTFTESAEALPVQIMDIKPKKIEDRSGLRAGEHTPWGEAGFEKVLMDIQLQGRYHNVGLLLERLEDAALFFRLESLRLDLVQGIAPNLSVYLTLASFIDGKSA